MLSGMEKAIKTTQVTGPEGWPGLSARGNDRNERRARRAPRHVTKDSTCSDYTLGLSRWSKEELTQGWSSTERQTRNPSTLTQSSCNKARLLSFCEPRGDSWNRQIDVYDDEQHLLTVGVMEEVGERLVVGGCVFLHLTDRSWHSRLTDVSVSAKLISTFTHSSI